MSNYPEYLIDQLDQSLSGAIAPELSERLVHDQELAHEWQTLNLAVMAIREAGLNDQVAAIRKEFLAQPLQETKQKPAVVRTLYKNVLRIAASVIILAAAVSIYKYSTVNSVAVYDQYYSAFELNTSRGAGSSDAMEQAFRDKQWKEVVNQFNGLQVKNNKSYFLAGMADMELKNPAAAAPLFEQIIDKNKQSGENYFQDEAEYYLAIAYLGNHESGKAIVLLRKIKADKDHLYNRVVSNMSWLDLNIAAFKDSK